MRRSVRAVLGLAVAAACLLLILLFPKLATQLRSMARLFDFAHVLLFGVITLGLASAFGRPAAPGWWPTTRRLTRLLAIIVLLGALVESLQPSFGRTAQFGDLIRNAAGAVAGLLFFISLNFSQRWRRLLRTLAIIFCLAFLYPVVMALWDESRARSQFPVLADFESEIQLSRFHHHRCRLTRVKDGTGHHLSATFYPDQYPRLGLEYFPTDWRGYRALVFSAENPEEEPLDLRIRIDDIQHTNTPPDRFTLNLSLASGRHSIEIPLDTVRNAPYQRQMDLGHIAALTIYGRNITGPRQLLVDDLRLIGDDQLPVDPRPSQ